MRKLNIPDYDWLLVGKLTAYARSKVAVKPWKSKKTGVPDFKQKLTELLLIEQRNRCAYCGMEFKESKPARDHIAPENKYIQWIFRPENLVLSCFSCNSEEKHAYDPIVRAGLFYRDCDFEFVHPYFDEPDGHIKLYGADRRVLIDLSSSSKKGNVTVKLFGLDTDFMAKQRAKDGIMNEDIEGLDGKWHQLLVDAKSSLLVANLKTKLDK